MELVLILLLENRQETEIQILAFLRPSNDHFVFTTHCQYVWGEVSRRNFMCAYIKRRTSRNGKCW